jgi:hypothetical protein
MTAVDVSDRDFESYRRWRSTVRDAVPAKVAGVIPGLLIAYLVVRWADLLLSGAIASAFSGVAGLMFWVENLLLVAALAMLMPAAKRASAKNLCQASFVLMLGCAVLKFNMHIVSSTGRGGATSPRSPRSRSRSRSSRSRSWFT